MISGKSLIINAYPIRLRIFWYLSRHIFSSAPDSLTEHNDWRIEYYLLDYMNQ